MREQFLSSQKKSSDRSFSHLKEGSILQRAFGNTRRSNRLKTQASNGVHLENGKIPNSDVFANPGSGTVISQLQEEISELRMLVTAQGNMMRRQVEIKSSDFFGSGEGRGQGREMYGLYG